MNGEIEPCFLPCASDDVPDRARRERRAPLRHEDIGRFRVLSLELPERPKLRTSKRVLRVVAALGTFDIEVTALQIDLAPLERHKLGGSQILPIPRRVLLGRRQASLPRLCRKRNLALCSCHGLSPLNACEPWDGLCLKCHILGKVRPLRIAGFSMAATSRDVGG
jgi:hypothetical protein